MKKQLIAAGFVFFSLISANKASAADFSQLYVFGDSLSDTGNTFTPSKNLTETIKSSRQFASIGD